MRTTRTVCAVYVTACLLALFLTAATAVGWLARGPAGWFADLLGLPWSLLVGQMADPGVVGEIVLVAAAMTLNLAIIFAVGRWLAERTARGG